MTTSNSYNYSQTRLEIMNDALNLLGVSGEGYTPTQADYDLCSRFLNDLIKYWAASGVCSWALTEGYIFPAVGQSSYSLGSNNAPGGDHATNTAVITTTSANAIATATTITLTSVTSMSVNDNIGILLSDNTRQWTTITNINTGTKVVTLNNALTGAVASGNSVYTYTTKLLAPLRVLNIRRKSDSNNTEIKLVLSNREQYFNLPDKTSVGEIINIYYQKQVSSGLLYIYKPPSSAAQYMTFTYLRDFQDMDSNTDTPDFPQEWLLVFKLNLAAVLCPAYGLTGTPKAQYLVSEAEKVLNYAREFDQDMGSYQFKSSNY